MFHITFADVKAIPLPPTPPRRRKCRLLRRYLVKFSFRFTFSSCLLLLFMINQASGASFQSESKIE
jgi:hypothetical protein